MNLQTMQTAVERFGTPLYLFDVEAFHSRCQQVKAAWGESVNLCFSIKANPFLVDRLPDCISNLEVCSPGELTICEKRGVEMSRVIFSGVNKSLDEVRRAAEDGVGLFTAESLLHLQHIQQAAEEKGTTLPVLVRLSAKSQFGIDEETFLHIIDHRQDYPNLEIKGIHYFSGTQKKKAAVIEKELTYLTRFLADLEMKHDFRMEKVEYGTGLGVEYFADRARETEQALLEAVAPALRELAKAYELTVEMGRFFAAPCGTHFTTVADTKTNYGINYAICDSGLHMLKYDGQIQGMQIPPVQKLAGQEVPLEDWTLCGSLCTTADVLARKVPIGHLVPGDVLAFGCAGAYSVTEGIAAFLSREMPAVALRHPDGTLEQLRGILRTDTLNIARMGSEVQL